MKGQDHIVAALRNSIINGREGQAYLFSGPRGTGKTTTARILAKVLNCTNLVDGEPCCECESCVAVEKGTSYDVHELDAASNNGVDAMRDLIERANLGTPGRHRVYILDEVHMLSKGAEAALLKTLEEPPPHVVFVLATTDPQKVSDTIISRCQPLQFHLLPMDVLEDHVRWLAGDAGIDLDDATLDSVLRQGRGSARDTLSALELVATSGGRAPEETPLDEFVEALIEHDPARALTAVAASVNRGRDSRTVAEELVAHLRDCFLSLMAPELVMLPDRRAAEVGALAQRLGAAPAVRAIETIGTMLVEMRHAPDPRVLLEVALVKLSNPGADAGAAGLAARVERLEQQLAGAPRATSSGQAERGAPLPSGRPDATAHPAAGSSEGPRPAAATRPDTPAGTGAAVAGGTRSSEVGRPSEPARSADGPRPMSTGGRLNRGAPAAASSAVAPGPAARSGPGNAGGQDDRGSGTGGGPVRAAGERMAAASAQDNAQPTGRADDGGAPDDRPTGRNAGVGAGGPVEPGRLNQVWADVVLPGLRPLVKALYAAGRLDHTHEGVTLVLPNDAHRRRCEEYLSTVAAALSAAAGGPVSLRLAADGESATTPRSGQAGGSRPPAAEPEDEAIDMSELVDAPAEPRTSGIDRVAAAFPGAQLLDEEQ